MRIGIGHDTHRLVEGRPLVLGGVNIDYPKGLLGHSDADVVMHAVTDALLGAAGIGDIGEHFPDTDPQWKDAVGADLLASSCSQVNHRGWKVVNVDLTVHAQEPRLSAHKAQMAANIAECLQLHPTDVNVKAKTGEGVGPVGNGEAITCEAVVLIRRSSLI